MKSSVINGKRCQVPDVATAEQLRQAGGIKPGRRIIAKKYDGNYPVNPGDSVVVNDGDHFVDAPPRTKG